MTTIVATSFSPNTSSFSNDFTQGAAAVTGLGIIIVAIGAIARVFIHKPADIEEKDKTRWIKTKTFLYDNSYKIMVVGLLIIFAGIKLEDVAAKYKIQESQLKKATAKLNNSLTSNKLLEYDLSDTKSQLQTAHKNNKDLLSENSALQQQNSALQTESKFLQTRIDEFNEFIQPLDTAYSEVTLKYMQMTGMDTNPTSAYIQLNIDVLNKLHKEFPGLAAEEFARRLQFALTEAGFLNATTAE